GGHPEPVLVTAAEPARLLPAPLPGRGVGFPDPGSRELVDVVLAEGDTVLLYTDGLVESRKDVDEGQSRLLKLAEAHRIRPVAGLPRELVTRMHDVVLHADDTVVLALRRTAAS
ncbi:PP2C family protein-serine/threonine phosphatase, partial [Amycolatopsis mediterranei]